MAEVFHTKLYLKENINLRRIDMQKKIFTILVFLTIFFPVFIVIVWTCWTWLGPSNRDSVIPLSGNYVYVDHDICLKDKDGTLHLAVPDDVCNYMYDNQYIIALQRPSFMRADYFWMLDQSVNSDSIESLKRMCYELIDCYWIVDVSQGKTIGPLSRTKFEEQCVSMKITISMK